jgi:hypothetical protein
METALRPAGKRGLRAASHIPELELKNFGYTVGTAPLTGDVSGSLQDWGMLGNNRYGICGPAATEHGRMAKALLSVANGVPTFEPGFKVPSDTETEALYFAYGISQGEPGPQPDYGVDNATWNTWLFQQTQLAKLAGDDVQEFAFGEISTSTPNLQNFIHQSMLDFHGVLIGVYLPDTAESDFENRIPWHVTAQDQPDPRLGHDILLVRYDATGNLVISGYHVGEQFVTWGGLQWSDVNFDLDAITDIWVFVTAEDAARTGVNYQGLLATCKSLGGSVAPTPPPPVPPPSLLRVSMNEAAAIVANLKAANAPAPIRSQALALLEALQKLVG